MSIDLTQHMVAGYSSDIPEYSWNEFYENVFVWNQGEHVGMIGPTGQGKTNLGLLILPKRQYIVTFATKPRDTTLDLYCRAFGYKKLAKWNPRLSVEKYPRRLLWPDSTKLRQSVKLQQEVFLDALDDIYTAGGWTVDIDELWWFAQKLNMGEDVKVLLQQGRSMDISSVNKTQRPAWVPLEVYDMSTHLFFWADNDETNLKRISSVGSFNSHAIRARVATLHKFQVLYVNTRDKFMCTVRPPLLIIKQGGEKE